MTSRVSAVKQSSQTLPLVVDLDGTLTNTDTLFETAVRVFKSNPGAALTLPLWLLRYGRAGLKQRLAEVAELEAADLPFRDDVCSWLAEERLQGRAIYLATAADASIANDVANHLRLFDGVIASDGARNNKGGAKLESIRAQVGAEFSYAGDSAADLAIWSGASAAVLVGVSASTRARLPTDLPIEKAFPRMGLDIMGWLRALRVHQWLKNLLIFVPLLTAFAFNGTSVLAAAMAFLAFSLVASGTYLINDLNDIESDRKHPRKRTRALASGALGLAHGLLVAGALVALGFAIATLISPAFFGWLVTYLVLTLLYSWQLKRYVLMDVITLAGLYTLRNLAGAAAVGVQVSFWLLAFSSAIFLSLALVKRCAELLLMAQEGKIQARGRDYGTRDLPVLMPLGLGAALGAVVVFLLFVREVEIGGHYGSPQILWLVPPLLTYWLARLWTKTGRGEMHDDPLVYALRDNASRVVIALILTLTLLAHFANLRLQ